MPDEKTLQLMMQRKAEVEQTKLVQRAMALPRVDKQVVRQALSLIVVREFGLPDSAADALLLSDANDRLAQDNRQAERVATMPPCHSHSHRPSHWRSPGVTRSMSARQHSQLHQQPVYMRSRHTAQPFCPVHDRYQVSYWMLVKFAEFCPDVD